MLKETIESLYGQAETINVFLNNYDFVPAFLNQKGINTMMLDNSTGDAAKFYGVEKLKGYIFTCDDDLVYQANYIKKTIKKLQLYKDKAIVTYHGKNFEKPITDFYHGKQKKYHCLMEVDKDIKVEVGGTGVMAFHNTAIRVKYKDFYTRNMADIHISRLAKQQKVDIICLRHLHNEFRYKSPHNTIWDDHNKDCEVHTKEVNKFL